MFKFNDITTFTYADLELNILKQINKDYKYIARDYDGDIWAYQEQPFKYLDMWTVKSDEGYIEWLNEVYGTHGLFKYIQWENEFAYSIKDLIEFLEFQQEVNNAKIKTKA